jgi:predicted chitinase
MQPIAEYGKGKGRPYGNPGRNGGQAPYGRGYVQLTWDENYEKADKELRLNGALIADYDKAMEPSIAAAIMVRGMQEGWFTGKKLSNYLPGDYINARRVINGVDKSAMIAGYARAFEKALTA